ncbi:AMP-binding protein [Dactylosporangium siamense]|uniref:AMP-dependent synthetase/ligase domain-containing protein n=1 Tax=Dactylosporangium siamense TaxID=685454 RepID=A0A919PP72_9ACTN|nr:AMP-binding protein [Dactylosporangium siamense]GIG47594.1 hypothetical protein Dsi01nite_056350 [Dactylosporangium siamense]
MTLLHPDARLIDAATGAELSGVPLREAVHAAVAGFAELTPGVVFLRTPTTVQAIVRYIGAFEAGRPLALLDPGLPAETVADFVDRFEPAAVCGPPPSDAYRGSQPEVGRGPQPDGHRGPPSSDAYRGSQPEAGRWPQPDGHRGPPPSDAHRGPQPEAGRGPQPDGHRGLLVPDAFGGASPSDGRYGSFPSDGHRGSPPSERHRGPQPGGRVPRPEARGPQVDGHRGYTRRSGELWERDAPSSVVADPGLATLLATSGSTGSPKLVRLSRDAILANTTAIIEALGITGDDVAVSSLPFYYSFGMSVLNTHLAAGATVVVESAGLVARSFWAAVGEHRVTSLALVPSQYEMLRRLRFDPRRYPSLRTLTQAGGRLRAELVRDFHDRMASVGGRLFVMYGQTEAAPRLTTLPAERLAEKLGSVGPAVPGGRLTVRLDDGAETTEPGVVGEVLYRGPNVMMGYAETAADLARGDEQGGLLETGDLGHLDEEGYLFIDGRLKRFGKVFGVRLNLDDIERLAAAGGPGAVAAVAGDDKVLVFVEGATAEELAPRVTVLADRLQLHWSGFELRGVPALPLLSNGKVDYRALESAR